MWSVDISAKTEAPHIFFLICVQCGPLFLLWENVRACGPKFWNNEQNDTAIKIRNSMVFSFHVSIPTATKPNFYTKLSFPFFLSQWLCVRCVGNSNSPILTDTEMIFPLRLFCAVAIAGFIFVDGGGVIIPSTLDGPFEPVTVPFDESLRGNAVDLPDSDPRVKRRVKGFEPEQISISLSAHYDSVWISWITGISISFSHFDSFSSKRISFNSLLTLPLVFFSFGYFSFLFYCQNQYYKSSFLSLNFVFL